jgi:predicted RNase H-like HicB family nuclease
VPSKDKAEARFNNFLMYGEYNASKGRTASVVLFISMRTIEDMRTFTFPVIIEKDKDGFYAVCPALPGCISQGDTYKEAVANIKEAMELYVGVLLDERREVPTPKNAGLPVIEISV